MNNAADVLKNFREERLKERAEALRWERYRRDADPPNWIVGLTVALLFIGNGGLALFLILHPNYAQEMGPLRYILTPGIFLLLVLLWALRRIAIRRERALIQIIRDEAPSLHQRLVDEGIINR